ncbi:MAG: hypothetical protein AVDCRST_MAG17-2292, partial [uncultured Solirubrobacterales bacterium]
DDDRAQRPLARFDGRRVHGRVGGLRTGHAPRPSPVRPRGRHRPHALAAA